MANPTVYNYTRIDDLKVDTAYIPTVTVDTVGGKATFKFKWKANGYFDSTVTCTFQLSGGSETAMTIVGGTSGVVTLKGNLRQRFTKLVWNAHEDILPKEHTDVTLKLQFNDGTRDIPIAETGTSFTSQSLDYRKQITKFSLNGGTAKDGFGFSATPQAIFFTPEFLTEINARPILEKATDTTFASVNAISAYDYSTDNGSTWTTGSASNGNAMTTPQKIRMTSGTVADDTKEYFRVRMHPVDFV
jgi:hypothetical protein